MSEFTPSVVLIQNTGLLETGDALRGTAMRMPLVCLETVRGHARMAARGLRPTAATLNADLLSRPDLDSVALLTEPTLAAWGVPSEALSSDEDMPRLGEAFRRAGELEQPVAVLVTRETVASWSAPGLEALLCEPALVLLNHSAHSPPERKMRIINDPHPGCGTCVLASARVNR